MQKIKSNKMKTYWITTTTWGEYRIQYTLNNEEH